MRPERERANNSGMKQETKKVTIFVGSAHKGGAKRRVFDWAASRLSRQWEGNGPAVIETSGGES